MLFTVTAYYNILACPPTFTVFRWVNRQAGYFAYCFPAPPFSKLRTKQRSNKRFHPFTAVVHLPLQYGLPE